MREISDGTRTGPHPEPVEGRKLSIQRPSAPFTRPPQEVWELDIVTFGCRLSGLESEVIRAAAGGAGGDGAVIDTAGGVTAEAERQARQAIRRARRARPNARLIVTGCAAQIRPERYAAMPEVDQVLGNEAKLERESYAATSPRVLVGDIRAMKATAAQFVDAIDRRARAIVQVQQGCDHRCTFCIIPQGRGDNRSVPIGDIVQQARALVALGHREIVLSDADITGFAPGSRGR